MTLSPPPDAGQAYRAWAPHYDAFMAHPAYAGWVTRVERLASARGGRGARALDVGCGTGKSTQPLLALGYDVVACDPSREMLAALEAKLGPRVPTVEAGLPDLPALGSFGYVSALNDVVNYLLDEDALAAGFAAVAENLAPDGAFVFDTSTQALYRDHYAGLRWRETGDAAVLWRGETPGDFEPGGLASAVVEVFEPRGGLWARASARHVQRHHPTAVVERALGRAGLRLAALFGQHDDGHLHAPLDPDDHTKAVHLAVPAS